MNVSMQIVQSPAWVMGVATDKIEGAHENKRSRAGVLFRALANLESQKPRGKQIAYIWFKCICFREKKKLRQTSLYDVENTTNFWTISALFLTSHNSSKKPSKLVSAQGTG